MGQFYFNKLLYVNRCLCKWVYGTNSHATQKSNYLIEAFRAICFTKDIYICKTEMSFVTDFIKCRNHATRYGQIKNVC